MYVSVILSLYFNANSPIICMYLTIYNNVNLVIFHLNDVIMGAIASQITSLTIVHSTVYSDADQRKHQSSVLLAICAGNSPVPGKCFHLMTSSCPWLIALHMASAYTIQPKSHTGMQHLGDKMECGTWHLHCWRNIFFFGHKMKWFASLMYFICSVKCQAHLFDGTEECSLFIENFRIRYHDYPLRFWHQILTE